MTVKNTSLKEVFPEPPMAALRQGHNLRRLLCRARLSPQSGPRPTRATCTAPGWRKCAKNRRPCPTCPFAMEATSQVIGQVTGYCHTIKDSVNCQTENILYYWKCIKDNCPEYPRCEYIGRSRRSFQQRVSEHLGYVRREVLSEPSGNHFNTGTHNVSHLRGCVLEHSKSDDVFVQAVREHFLIQKFDTFRNGLNQKR